MKKVWIMGIALCLVLLGVVWMVPQNSAAAEGFAIARMEICKAIENSEPVGAAASFSASQEKVYCYLELKDIAKDTNITYVWKWGGQERLKMTQTIRAGAKWRTWGNKNLHDRKGDWSVEILDEKGAVVKTVKFQVE